MSSSRIVLPSARPMYAAAERWRDHLLIDDRSLFDGRSLDARGAAEELVDRVVKQADGGAGTFSSKLEGQLAGVSEDAVQVAAELLYGHCLIVSTQAVSSRTKMQLVDGVIAFRSAGTSPIPDDLRLALRAGVANPGQAYNSYRWKMFNYLVDVYAHVKTLGRSERPEVLGSFDAFHDFIQPIDDQTAWSQRYALEHLLFPDETPPMLNRDHRVKLLKTFAPDGASVRDVVKRLDPNVHYGSASGINFYRWPYREKWQGEPPVNDLYTSWARHRLQSVDLDGVERDYKLDGVRGFRSALDLATGGSDASEALRKAFQGTNLVDYRVYDDFLRWAAAEPAVATAALAELQIDPGPEAIDRFLAAVPVEGQLSGLGARLSLASCLLFATQPEELPPWRDTPSKTTMRLAGGYPPQEAATAGEHYLLFVERLDAILAAVNGDQPLLRDRLDAQSLAWTIAKAEPPEAWSAAMRQTFEDWRAGKADISPQDVKDPEEPIDPPVRTVVPTTLEVLAEQLHMDAAGTAWLQETVELLRHKRQIILQGPPGTGKTYIGRALAEFLAGDPSRVELVQFHPGTSYEDFVQGLRPDPDQPTQFRVVDGPLIRHAEAARREPDQTFVLLVDEINRGNVPAVFGELYYLLEYRERELTLMHGSTFSLPENLLIVATMNTADRSITSLDSALRRRFYVRDLRPEQTPVNGTLRRHLATVDPSLLWLADLLDLANSRIADPDQSVGPSHFMGQGANEVWAQRAWQNSVMPTLRELFYNHPARVVELEFEQLKAAVTTGPGDASAD